ncbi:MAG: hypothetical protein L6R39_007597 [Caloplaca ligustica]|nr:MAG: hypothetical protein L6R39_007597 [Caloplaca ligustica]
MASDMIALPRELYLGLLAFPGPGMRQSCIKSFSSLPLGPPRNLQPTTAIDNRRETILLYRALLRQCTYLPDPAARKYTWSYVVERFQDYKRIVRDKNGRPVRQKIKKKEPSRALHDARKSLKYLQRANDGHVPQLQTILDMTYGRVGKRSRQLMAKLQAPSQDAYFDDTFAGSSPDQDPTTDSRTSRKKVPQLTDELQALVESHIKHASSRLDGALPKGIKPDIPATNSWGRPFPQKRKANFVRNWYATTLGRLMPPLPAAEWERLRGLASGEIPWGGVVPRRKLGTTKIADESEDSFDTRLAVGIPHPQLPHRLTSSTLRVVEQGRHPEMRTNPHVLTPRFMRGMWCRVFQISPRLDWSLEERKWSVTWGRLGKQKALVFDPQRSMPVGMFDGVDEEGKVRTRNEASGLGEPRAEQNAQPAIS